MMNINNEDFSLGLAFGSTRYSISTILNNFPGAGVNAKSRVDMAFAASDPLSELVWSSHNGLILKCTNSRLADKKPILLWNVGLTSRDLSPSQNIRSKGSEDDDGNSLDQGNLTMSQQVLVADDLIIEKANSGPSRSFLTPELHASCGGCDETESNSTMEKEGGMKDAMQKEKNCTYEREKDLCRLQSIQVGDIAEIGKKDSGLNTLADGISDCKVDVAIKGMFSSEHSKNPHCNQESNIEIHASSGDIMDLDVADPEPLASKFSEALACSPPNLQPQKESGDIVISATGEMNKDKANQHFPVYVPPLKKLEPSAENKLFHLTAKEVSGSGETKLCTENCLYQEKGKEKALSDGDIYGRSSNDEEDSHESVESCNSAGLFWKGPKRQIYDNGMILGSKRMKKQVDENHGSTSNIRPNNSFKNWISNMMKGVSDSNKEHTPSLAMSFACSNDVYGKNHQENFSCKKMHDSASMNMGFQTMFQSLHWRNTIITNNGVQHEDRELIEEPRELTVAEKTSPENLALSCEGNSDSSCKQIVVANKDVNPILVDRFPYACKGNLAENKASEVLVCNRAKDGVSQSDSSGKQMNTCGGKMAHGIPMGISDVAEKNNHLTSLWITRLSTGTHMVEKHNELTQETNRCSTYGPKINLDTRVNDFFPFNQKSSETEGDSADCQVYASFAARAEASVQLKSTSKLSPILPSQKFRSSEAMASVFARRLDALRHIVPLDKRNSPTCSVRCFFCGSGHDLRECPNVTETELEELLVKMNSFEKIEDSTHLCIRCFRLDHLAISCPSAPLSRQWKSKWDACAISPYTSCHPKLDASNEKCSSYHVEEDDNQLIAADPEACGRKLCSGAFPSNQMGNLKKPSSKLLSTSNKIRRHAASNLANEVIDEQKFPLCNIITAQNTVAPSTEIVRAIRNLRLSRADILSWMNSDVSLSHLNGFFLRLRLGKLEAGLGAASYYVACITGDAQEHNDCKSKKSILVDVGGIKSSVGSQYVSNHDFLEDEIKTWWCTIVKNGCAIPSLDELNSKFNDKKSLGF